MEFVKIVLHNMVLFKSCFILGNSNLFFFDEFKFSRPETRMF